jgi:hypothetical protein
MKLEKKHYIIIAVIAVILVWYFFLRKKKAESGFEGVADPFSGQECEQGENPQDFSGCVEKKANKAESNYRMVRRTATGTQASSACPEGFVWTGSARGCVHKDILNPK